MSIPIKENGHLLFNPTVPKVHFDVFDEECYLHPRLVGWLRRHGYYTVDGCILMLCKFRYKCKRQLGWTADQCTEAGKAFATALREIGVESEIISRYAIPKDGRSS